MADYDGLGFTAAVGLCVARAHSLSSSETTFLMKINQPGREVRAAERLRLADLVRKLRQDDLVDFLYRKPSEGAAQP
jgi:hypothetical protein